MMAQPFLVKPSSGIAREIFSSSNWISMSGPGSIVTLSEYSDLIAYRMEAMYMTVSPLPVINLKANLNTYG